MENLEQQLIELVSRQDADAAETVRRACAFARERLSGTVRETGEQAYTHALRVILVAAVQKLLVLP